MASALGIVVLNLGGPDSPEAVEPFLRRLFSDPDVIQLGWASFIQPLFARVLARGRAAASRAAYAQIGGRSPIFAESHAQAAAIVEALDRRHIVARPYVAMACWHPFSDAAVRAMREDGIERAVAVPLYPHHSRTTTVSSFHALERALDGSGIRLARVERYPDAPGYIEAVSDRVREALRALPEGAREAPVLFSAHGLPESYIRGGDRYLDDIRITVAAVSRTLKLGARARLSFQSRVGPGKWLAPYTEEAIDRLADEGHRNVVICPIAFTGEHIETLQEIDILYRARAAARGIEHFIRTRTVGVHPSFIGALAGLAAAAAAERGWS